MNFLSLFTGVGGFDLGLERAGMTCIGQAERDPHCLKVLSYHYPNVPKFKDVRDVTRNTVPTVDLVCGGFPCQDVSVAGNRAGLAGERSGLWFEFLRILHELKPSWVVIENVPGLLNSQSGRDFATILHGLGECGYQSAWRVLDSQYWGVAQRRRRVFIVGCLGSGRAAEVLFEREGGYWNTPARRETGEGIAGTLNGGAHPGSYNGQDAYTGMPIPFRTAGYDQYAGAELASTVTVHEAKEFGDLIAYDLQQVTSWANRSNPKPGDPVFTLSPQQQGVITAVNLNASSTTSQPVRQSGLAGTLAGSRVEGLFNRTGVRRLTPMECERLQSFPDCWTAVDGMSDAQRYKQMGNAVTVNVIEWLGRRIAAAE